MISIIAATALGFTALSDAQSVSASKPSTYHFVFHVHVPTWREGRDLWEADDLHDLEHRWKTGVAEDLFLATTVSDVPGKLLEHHNLRDITIKALGEVGAPEFYLEHLRSGTDRMIEWGTWLMTEGGDIVPIDKTGIWSWETPDIFDVVEREHRFTNMLGETPWTVVLGWSKTTSGLAHLQLRDHRGSLDTESLKKSIVDLAMVHHRWQVSVAWVLWGYERWERLG